MDDYAKRLLADEKLALKKRNLKFYIIGLTLTILSPLSLILYTVISESETLVYLPITLLVLFVMASIGVSLLTNAGMRDEALASFDFEAQNAEKSTKKRIIDIYWSALPFLYLLVSFLTGRWDITWIIWPLSPIIPELITLFSKKKQ